MSFDDRIQELSRIIYQTSVMVHGSKQNPTEQIGKIKGMIRELIKYEVGFDKMKNFDYYKLVIDMLDKLYEKPGFGEWYDSLSLTEEVEIEKELVEIAKIRIKFDENKTDYGGEIK